MMSILEAWHFSPVRGHYGGSWTIYKIMQLGYYWPTINKLDHDYVGACDQCQRLGNILQRHELLITTILELKLYDFGGCEFSWHKNIFCGLDYVLKRVKVSQLSWKMIYSPILGHEWSLVLEDPIFSTIYLRSNLRNTRISITFVRDYEWQ